MAKLPVNPLAWLEPDRRWLYLALLALTHDRLTDGRLRVVRHVLLAEMEIYDDPRQGVGRWLFPDEEGLLDLLAEQLQALSVASVEDRGWPQVRRTASALLNHLEGNGAGGPLRGVG